MLVPRDITEPLKKKQQKGKEREKKKITLPRRFMNSRRQTCRAHNAIFIKLKASTPARPRVVGYKVARYENCAVLVYNSVAAPYALVLGKRELVYQLPLRVYAIQRFNPFGYIREKKNSIQ